MASISHEPRGRSEASRRGCGGRSTLAPAPPIIVHLTATLAAVLQLGGAAAPGASRGPREHADAPPPRVHDVIIVGSGVAGVAAAGALLSRGVRDVVMLEAKNHTGGRLHAVPFGGRVVEEGANWVHGVSPGTANPVWRAAAAQRLKTVLIPGSCSNVAGYGLRLSDGAPAGNATLRAALATAATNCLNRTSIANNAANGSDMTALEALAKCHWTAYADELNRTTQWEILQADYIIDNAELSMRWTLPDATYSRLGVDDHFVVDQRGYATIFDAFVEPATLGRIVEHNAVVAAVDNNETHGVTVRTEDGRTFLARRAVVTIPIGVMQRTHSTLFRSPPLPAAQTRGLLTFTSGNFTKIFARWKTPFWGDRGAQWLVGGTPSDFPGGMGPVEFHDLNNYTPGINTLFTYVVGDDAARWEALDDAAAAAALVARLKRVFPDRANDITDPEEFYMTRHSADPFMRGAYTAVKVGVPYAALTAMIQPVANAAAGVPTTFFAGEHTCGAFQGYLHGGLYSGLRAAQQAAESLLGRAAAAVAPSQFAYNGECNDVNLRAGPGA